MRSILLALVLSLASACGSDDSTTENNAPDENNIRGENNAPTPNNATNNGSTNNTATNGNNTTSNNTASNNTANNTTPNNTANNSSTNNSSTNNTANNAANNATTEVFDVEPNDDRASANPFRLGSKLTGTAEAGGQDYFEFNGIAGTIVELEFLSADLTLDVTVFLEDGSDEVPDRAIDLYPGAKRQFFIPKNGDWFISVRAFETVDRNYEMVVRQLTPTPIMDTFAAPILTDLNDHAVDVYLFPDTVGRISTNLKAERLADGSDLDSILFVYSPNRGLVKFNDDANGQGTTDSAVDFTAVAGEVYWLVVDGWKFGMDNPYELTVALP